MLGAFPALPAEILQAEIQRRVGHERQVRGHRRDLGPEAQPGVNGAASHAGELAQPGGDDAGNHDGGVIGRVVRPSVVTEAADVLGQHDGHAGADIVAVPGLGGAERVIAGEAEHGGERLVHHEHDDVRITLGDRLDAQFGGLGAQVRKIQHFVRVICVRWHAPDPHRICPQ